jgi:hypothetical protein
MLLRNGSALQLKREINLWDENENGNEMDYGLGFRKQTSSGGA